MNLEEAGKQFGRYLKMRGRADGTERSYRYLLEHYGRWLAGQKQNWQDVDGKAIELFLEEYRDSHSRTSTALIATCLRSFYKWARRRRLVEQNPTEDLETIERDRPAPRALEDSDVRALLAALDTLTGSIEGRRNRMIVRFFLFSGLRLSELAGLERSDVDIDARTIKVRKAKGGRVRIVALSDSLAADLLAWQLPTRGPLWLCSRGRLSAAGISEMFRDVIQNRLGFEGVTAHVLRHTHGTKLRRAGADLRGIQVQLGHAKPETTAIYTRVYDEELHQVVNLLNGSW